MASSCSAEALAALTLPSVTIQALSVALVMDYPISSELFIPNFGYLPDDTVDFCNVTITYTHEGEDDYPINLEAWLPSSDSWNERILALGGSGFAAGRYEGLDGALGALAGEGYAMFTTDGGEVEGITPFFALKEPGVYDEVAIANWATVALADMGEFSKDIVKAYYGQPALYSYFSGCSQGGRQGFELAQRYPNAFDGITASAPAMQLLDALSLIFWPQYLMYQAKIWPRMCEIDTLTAAAVDYCGNEDGVVDWPEECEGFDPFEFVGGRAELCKEGVVSDFSALVANATWEGLPDENGKLLYKGFHHGTDLTGLTTGAGIVITTCKDDEAVCSDDPPELGFWGVQAFSLKDANGDYVNITPEQFFGGLRESKDVIGKYVQSNDPDLSAFREHGGKFLTWHGLADQLVTSNVLRTYHSEVTALDPNASDYFRFFEIPGLGHCFGPQHPDSSFNALRAWVEEGIAPEKLEYKQTDASGEEGERIACQYPMRAKYKSCCGDRNLAKCWTCVEP